MIINSCGFTCQVTKVSLKNGVIARQIRAVSCISRFGFGDAVKSLWQQSVARASFTLHGEAMSAKHAALASHVRRLCLLGSEPRIVMPHVVEAIRKIAEAEWGMFFFANDAYELSDVYSQNDAVYDVLPIYFF